VRLRHRSTDAGSLADDSVFALLEDHHGAIWVGTQTGLDRFDLACARFQHVTLDPSGPVRVLALAEDRLGVLWIGSKCLRPSDRLVRWGGDEFVIVRTPSDIDDAAQLAEEIRSRIAELRFRVSDAVAAHTTCSIGFACYPFVEEAPLWATWEEVLNLADMALYRAKVHRDAWLGWCGLPRAARQTELFRLVSVDPRTATSMSGLRLNVTRRPCRSNFRRGACGGYERAVPGGDITARDDDLSPLASASHR
jgi:Diguanylate cyclase, GGDEF domain/Two component regulator propeller